MDEAVRIDKYLWCVRLAKTRSLATEWCRKGKVRMGEDPVKPSREVKVGDRFSLHDHGVVRNFKVLMLLKNRVGAKLVSTHLEDLTPEEVYQQKIMMQSRGFERRDRGAGRPTKRERRDIDRLKEGDTPD
jgi:ribosome-associated heat shock protein Hsp15